VDAAASLLGMMATKKAHSSGSFDVCVSKCGREMSFRRCAASVISSAGNSICLVKEKSESERLYSINPWMSDHWFITAVNGRTSSKVFNNRFMINARVHKQGMDVDHSVRKDLYLALGDHLPLAVTFHFRRSQSFEISLLSHKGEFLFSWPIVTSTFSDFHIRFRTLAVNWR
jgi:hypothetical protein